MHKFSSLVYLGIAVANAVLSIPLCMKWNALGAAIGTTISTTAGMLVMNCYYRRRVGLNISRFWMRIRHLVPAMILPAVTAVLMAVFLHPQGYMEIGLILIVFVAVYGASMWLFGMDRYERRLISAPLEKIVNKLKR